MKLLILIFKKFLKIQVQSGIKIFLRYTLKIFYILMIILPILPITSKENFGITGTLPTDKKIFKQISQWQSKIKKSDLPHYIDLRYNLEGERLFPPIGQQRLNDDVSWSVGYYLKSYHQAIKTGQLPTTSTKIFSPSFLYNQANGGMNYGSYLVDNLLLLQIKGALPLAQMPYTRNIHRLPDNDQLWTAKKYKITKFYRLKGETAFKQALFIGKPILVHLQADAYFWSGKYGIYKPKKERIRFRNRLTRIRHTVLIVGYDDINKSFIFMNSWGEKWGRGGVNRFSYDMLAQKDFIYEAYIIADHFSSQLPAQDLARSIDIQTNVRFLQYNRGQSKWFWQAFIHAPRSVARQIKSIQWHVVKPLKKLTGKDHYKFGEEITGLVHRKGVFYIHAKIKMKKQGEIEKQGRVVVYLPERASIHLEQDVKFYQFKKNKKHWLWNVYLKGSSEELYMVKKVTYHFPKVFKEKKRVIKKSVAGGFPVKILGPVAHPIRAEVEYLDGYKTEHRIQLAIGESAPGKIRLYNSSIPIGYQRGRKVYNFSLYLDGPLYQLNRIKKVEYHLHRNYLPQKMIIKTNRKYGFPLSFPGWGIFEVRARVFFSKQDYLDLRHTLHF